MVQGGLDLTPVITHRFHYTEFQKGFDAMNSGMSGKVILDWTTKRRRKQNEDCIRELPRRACRHP